MDVAQGEKQDKINCKALVTFYLLNNKEREGDVFFSTIECIVGQYFHWTDLNNCFGFFYQPYALLLKTQG